MLDQPQVTADTPALLAELIREQMGIPSKPVRVLVYNSAWELPAVDDLFVIVGVQSDDNFGSTDSLVQDPVTGALNNQQGLERATVYTVDLLSVTTEARRRRHEVIFALQGEAAQSLSEQYGLRIFRPSQFMDLSEIEGPRRMNRFQTQFTVFEGYGQVRPVPSMTTSGPRTEIQP